MILEIRNGVNILRYLHIYVSFFSAKIFYKFFIKEVCILAIYLSTHNLRRWDAFRARAAFGSEIRDLWHFYTKYIAQSDAASHCHIKYYLCPLAHKEKERGRGTGWLAWIWVWCVCACIKNARSKRVTARRIKRHEYGRGGFESENNIDPLFRPANKYHKYRPTELSVRSCTLQHRTSRFRSRIRLFSVHWRTWVCTTTVRGIGFAPRWPFVHVNKEVRIA